MKIIHINLQKTWRGGEQQLAYLMVSLNERKIEQLLICIEKSKLEAFAKKENLPHIVLKKNFLLKFIYLKKITSIITEKKIDIIHCHESKGHSLALFAKLLFNYKAKIILHRRVSV